MGTPPQPPPPAPPPPAPPGPDGQQGAPGIAIAGFVVGLVGLLGSWIPFFVIVPIVGLVLSYLGMKAADERDAPKGLAIAGLVCSIVGVVIGLIITIIVLVAVDETNDFLDDLTFTTTTFNVVVGLSMLRGRTLGRPRARSIPRA